MMIILPLVLVSLPFYFLIQLFILCKVSGTVSKLRKKENLAKAPILSLVNTMLEGLITIRSQRLEKKFTLDMENKVNEYYRCFITYQSYFRFCTLYIDLAGLVIIIVNLAVIINQQNLLDLGLVAYSLAASVNILSISSGAVKNVFELVAYLLSAQHLLEYQNITSEQLETSKTFLVSQGRLQFCNLSFRYQPQLPIVLSNLNFFINSGEKIGVVGRTGSGKSSLFHVICRLAEPESGTVLIDDQDYLKAGLHSLRQQISVIPQSAVLFSPSLKENLDPLGLYSDSDLDRVLTLVGLNEKENFFMINKETGETNWSAGERQLICIARAILSKNKIILIDEATSNIDIYTDRIIQKVIKSEFVGSTMIVIAHRILTAIDSDKVLVMHDANCVEFDKPQTLLNDQTSIFYSLAQSAGLIKL